MSERPTPETDEQQWDADLGNMVVTVEFARSLERRLGELRDAHHIALSRIEDLECRLGKALADLADMTADYLRRHKDAGDFMEANIALRARVKELEEALDFHAAHETWTILTV